MYILSHVYPCVFYCFVCHIGVYIFHMKDVCEGIYRYIPIIFKVYLQSQIYKHTHAFLTITDAVLPDTCGNYDSYEDSIKGR